MQVCKHGFVYIWYDRKHKRFYIGCHWGHEDDGYICSSTWMKQGYKHRPLDFKRKILETNILDRKVLLEREYYWLSMINDGQLGKRYYNLHKHHFGHWTNNPDKRLTIGQKISASPNRCEKISRSHTGMKHSDETKEKIRQIRIGTTLSESTKQKIGINNHTNYSTENHGSKISLTRKNWSEDVKQADSDMKSKRNKKLHAEGKIGMLGKKHSDETKKKMSEAALKRRTKKE